MGEGVVVEGGDVGVDGGGVLADVVEAGEGTAAVAAERAFARVFPGNEEEGGQGQRGVTSGANGELG